MNKIEVSVTVTAILDCDRPVSRRWEAMPYIERRVGVAVLQGAAMKLAEPDFLRAVGVPRTVSIEGTGSRDVEG